MDRSDGAFSTSGQMARPSSLGTTDDAQEGDSAGRNQRGRASLLCAGEKKGRAEKARPLNGVKAGRVGDRCSEAS